MKLLKIIPHFIFCLFISSMAYSQDLHWSQFNANPIFQNPGNTGHFKGDVRFSGNFRDQWRSVTRPYSTISLSVDANAPSIKNLGYGMLFFHDVTGDGSLRTIEVQGNVSYQFKLTNDSTHTIRPGINMGINHRQLDFNHYYFDNQYDGIAYNPTLPTNELLQVDRKTNFSIALGAIYQFYKTERLNFTIGLGAYNLNKPNQGFYNEVIQRDIRVNLFGKGIYKLNYDWDLLPSFSISTQGKYRELVVGSSIKYTLINKLGQYRALYGGLWYRNNDAGILSVGMDYQRWFVGLSYDINFSKLTPASRARGGFEIAIRYILNHFKPKQITHRICPDYI
ncbi:MAG: PorP/SprF family type IX secretion system membrane protein [Crocinitomicaceae bacterium]|nr:PorP/SprF family type IX secretion system membrane protein [Crocinitomicaceae bacterium]